MPAAAPQSKLAVFYKDFNIGMRHHPVTGGLLQVKNAESVKQGVRNLILTNHNDRIDRIMVEISLNICLSYLIKVLYQTLNLILNTRLKVI